MDKPENTYLFFGLGLGPSGRSHINVLTLKPHGMLMIKKFKVPLLYVFSMAATLLLKPIGMSSRSEYMTGQKLLNTLSHE